jgi:hypothetical protein
MEAAQSISVTLLTNYRNFIKKQKTDECQQNDTTSSAVSRASKLK